MTTRDDVTVDFRSSPRVAEVASPSVQMTMQDLVDTLRKLEDQFTQGVSFEKLLKASGKEDLGGGVKVGITVAQQNLLLAFEGRTTPAQVGTVTGAPANPVASRQTMQDSAASFITNSIQRGSLLVNFSDLSVAEVYRVNSETELETKILVEGTTNTYQAADVYKIWNIVQCNATGGNLVALDEFGATLPSPILPTAFTQIILTSSASATLAEQADIQYSSFNGAVTVDLANQTGNAVAGTVFPAGTERTPSNNFSDARAIAVGRGFLSFRILGDSNIDTGLDYTDYRFFGQGKNLTLLTLDPAALFVNSSFFDAQVTGTLDGDSQITDCMITSLTFVSGVIENCILDVGTITLGGSLPAHMINCASGVPGVTTPIIDLGGSGQDLALRNYNGGITLTNLTGAQNVSIDLNSGHIILDSTLTAGTVVCRGVGKVTDNSGVGCTVINEVVNASDINILRKLMQNRMETDPVTGIMTVYDDDDITVLLSGNIYEDVLAAQTYRGRGMERRNRLT